MRRDVEALNVVRLIRNASLNPLAATSFYAFAARCAGAFMGLVLTLLLPRALPVHEVGIVYLGLSMATTLSVVQRLGLDYTAWNQSVDPVQKSKHFGQIYTQAIFAFFAANIIVLPILCIVVLGIGGKAAGLPDALTGPVLLVWSTGLSISFILFQMYRSAGHAVNSVVTRNCIQPFSFIIIVMVIILSHRQVGVSTILLAFSASVVTVSVIDSLNFFRLEGSGNADLQPKIAAEWISKSLPFCIYYLIMTAFYEIDIWIVSAFLDTSQTATYATAKRLMLMIAIFIDIANIVLPKRLSDAWAHGSTKDVEQLLKKASTTFFLLSLLVLILVAVGGRYVIGMVFPPEFIDSYYALLILLAAQSTSLLLGFGELVLVMKGERTKLIRSALAGLALNVLVSAALVTSLGMNGVAIGYLIGSACYRIAISRQVRMTYGISTVAGRLSR